MKSLIKKIKALFTPPTWDTWGEENDCIVCKNHGEVYELRKEQGKKGIKNSYQSDIVLGRMNNPDLLKYVEGAVRNGNTFLISIGKKNPYNDHIYHIYASDSLNLMLFDLVGGRGQLLAILAYISI